MAGKGNQQRVAFDENRLSGRFRSLERENRYEWKKQVELLFNAQTPRMKKRLKQSVIAKI